MKSRLPISLWLMASALLSVIMWLGCEQKGELSPTSTNRRVLAYIDTIIVNPLSVGTGDTASIEARILNENNEPARGEPVRFSVNRGVLAGNEVDTTVNTDNDGSAKTTYTSPSDTGIVTLRTELVSMSELRTSQISVSGSSVNPTTGLLEVWMNEDTLFADNGTSSTTVYARLRNEAHNPIGGVLVNFSTSLGSITSPMRTDMVSGIATAVLSSSNETGQALITARYGSNVDSAHCRFLTPSPAGRITVTVSNGALVAGLDSTTVTARIYDTEDRPIVDNTLVLFSVSRGTVSAFTARSSGGVATTRYYAPTTIGGATISATTGGTVSGSTDVTIAAGRVARITITATHDTLAADNSSETAINAFAVDTYGNPVAAGIPIGFTAQNGTITGTAPVGSDGHAIATFRASLNAGQASVTATNLSVQGSHTIYLSPTIPTVVSLNANPLDLVANGTSTSALRVLVLDSRNLPVSNGTLVTFTSLSGQITGGSPTAGAKFRDDTKNPFFKTPSASLATSRSIRSAASSFKSANTQNVKYVTTSTITTATTDGYAYATLTSSTTAGSDEITATAGSLTDLETVTYSAGTPARIIITPTATQLPADGISSTPIACRVEDAFGNNVGGGIAISINTSLGTLNPSSGFTNAAGVFTSNLITTRQLGTSAITATSGTANGYGEVAFIQPQVAGVQLTASSHSILADGVSSTGLSAYAADMFGLPVSNAVVNWQTPQGLGRLIALTTVTNGSGIAEAIFYSGASNSDDSQPVSAIIGTHSNSQTIIMRGVSMRADVDQLSIPANGSSTANVSVHVNETTSGYAIIGANVFFSSSQGSIAQSALSDSSGNAVAVFHSDRTPGLVAITCTYGDTLRAATGVRLTNTEAELLTVNIGANELLANGVTTTPVSAIVYNEGGATVAHTPVTFTANGPGYFTPAEVESDDSGRVLSVYHSGALNQDQQVSLDVAIQRTTESLSIMLRGVTLDVTTTQSAIPANGNSTTQIRMELRESTSMLAISGVAVQFAASIGTIPFTAMTNSSGIAIVNYTSASEPGQANIIGRYGNLLTDTVLVDLYTPSASTAELLVNSTTLLGSGAVSTPVTTVLTDQQGRPLANTTVNWSLSGPGTLSAQTSLTNESGIAANTFTAAATREDAVTMLSVTSGSATNHETIQTTGISVVLSGSIAMMPANGVSTSVIQAQITETTSHVPLADAIVYFGSSLGSLAGSGITDNSGVASAQLTASATPGIATIVARYGNALTDTLNVQMFAPVPHTLVLIPGASSIRADGVDNTLLRVYVEDVLGVPVARTNVRWSATGVVLNDVQTMTNDSGLTSITFQSNASTQDIQANIVVTAGEASTSTVILERGVTISAGAIPNTVIADGSSRSQIQVHVFETTSNIAIENQVISFGTTLGTIPNAAVTDASGIATATLVSSTQTGIAQVEVSMGNVLTSSVNVSFAQSTPTTLSLTASPTILTADNASASTLTAVVTDQNGNPVPNGTQIRFSLPPQSGSIENLRTTTGGVATNVLTSSSTPDTVTLTAWAENNPSARDSVSIIYRVGPPSVVTLSALRDTLRADGIQVDTIVAHVTDAIGHSLSNIDVRFSTTIGNITASRVTDEYGNARVAFSSPLTGTALVTADASGAQGTYTVYLVPGAPNSIQMEYAPNSVGVRGSGRNETLLITATVRDANNNHVLDGTPVYFNINNSPGGGDFLSSNGPIPTINGTASVSYNSGTVSGSVRIRAICADISAVSTEIQIFAGPPYIENIGDGCVTSHMSLGSVPCNLYGMDVVGDTVDLVCLVGDRYNNPVTPGTAVYFTTSGGVVTTATGYTDSSGFARVRFFGGNPLPTIDRWMNTLEDPNMGGPILCQEPPTQPGVAKVMASSAGVDANGDSVIVWSTTEVTFNYTQSLLFIRSATVNGDPELATLYIGQNALINFATYDPDFWPLVSGTKIKFSASKGLVYPSEIEMPCPGDTSFTISFFNNLTLADDDGASPVLINIQGEHAGAYAFTRTFTLRAALPPAN